MATPKSPDAFPLAFSMILDRFRDSNAEPVTTHYPRAADAAKIRFTFYSFKKALGKAGRADDLRVANGILVRLIDDPAPSGGASLEFSLRDNLGWALDLEAAILRAQGSTPSPSQPLAPTPHASASPSAPTSDSLVDKYMAGGLKA